MDIRSIPHAPVVRNLASGSSANALLVHLASVTILIDCGLPIKALAGALRSLGLGPGDIDLVYVTHEHSDHVRSLSQLRSRGATIVTSPGTAQALGMTPSDYIPALAGKTRDIAGCSLTPVPVSHDSAEPLGITLRFGDQVLTIVTDTGCSNDYLVESIADSTIVVLEANHDTDMLRIGPYPPHLKRRIASSKGHLSNDDCARALLAAYERGAHPDSIFLAHLSRTNNDPNVAVSATARSIGEVPVQALPPRETVDLLVPPPRLRSGHVGMIRRAASQMSLWSDERSRSLRNRS